MSLILNVPELWIYQGYKQASGFEYATILKIPEFWICQGYTGFRICVNNSWICMIMSGHVWIWLNMPEYAWTCQNLLEWLLFYTSSFPHLFYNPFFTWTRGYLFERLEVTVWRNRRLFSSREKIWFFCSSWKYLI